MGETNLSASDAAAALHDLRDVREGPERRAAGLSLMVWALVVTSMAGTLITNGLTQMLLAGGPGSELSENGWLLFVLSSIALLLFWVALGTVLQRVVIDSFSIRRAPGSRSWRPALVAAGIVFLSVLVFGFTQDLTRAIQGIGTTPDQYDALHHNLGFAMAMGLSGTVFLAIVLAQRDLGLPRGPAAATAVGMIAFGHLTTFLWFPDLGIAGALAATLVLPLGLITYGLHLWRRG